MSGNPLISRKAGLSLGMSRDRSNPIMATPFLFADDWYGSKPVIQFEPIMSEESLLGG